jgi:hypothetical protein
VFELPESTLVLPPAWEAEVDAHGTVVACRLGIEAGNGRLQSPNARTLGRPGHGGGLGPAS